MYLHYFRPLSIPKNAFQINILTHKKTLLSSDFIEGMNSTHTLLTIYSLNPLLTGRLDTIISKKCIN